MCVCVCSIVPLEADPSEGKAVSGDRQCDYHVTADYEDLA